MTAAASRSSADDVIAALGPPAERARALLRRHELRCTAPRVAVLVVLAAAPPPGHRAALEIFQAVNADGLGVDLTSVYRTLSTLQDKGIVHQLIVADTPASYGLADHQHHHAVCTRCAAVSEVDQLDFAEALQRAERSTLFTFAATGSITLHGLCPACRDQV